MANNPSAKNTDVLIVDDHTIVRDGLRMLLEKEDDIAVVGHVGSAEEALDFLRWQRPQVILMDIGLPGMNGIEATRRVKEIDPAIQVLALTMHAEDQYLLAMLEAGATGYLLKQTISENLVQAVRLASKSQSFLDPSIARQVIDSLHKSRHATVADDTLTEREKEILNFIRQGFTSKEIAEKLFLSAKTVENYRARILRKLQVKNCSEAISRALDQHILEPLR
jgi:DNA-binding NarL/FixJ family response regulator